MELGFGTELTNDCAGAEEGDLLSAISEMVSQDEQRTSVLSVDKMYAIKEAIEILRPVAKQSRASFSYKLNAPFKSMGSVSIIGKNICFNDANAFCKAANLASNFEVYPKTDGKICVTFTFHGLTTPIE